MPLKGKPAGTWNRKRKRCKHAAIVLGDGVLAGCASRDAGPADVHVCLDRFLKDDFPDGGEQVVYHITNFRAPRSPSTFVALVDALVLALDGGKTVQVFCMGGHGRTGLVLAAVLSRFGYDDPIKFLRGSYCEKAVETQEQVDFLVANYGVPPAEPRYKSIKFSRSRKSESKLLVDGPWWRGSEDDWGGGKW